MFSRLGVVRYPAGVASEDAMLEAAIEAGADDVASGPDGHEVTTPIGDLFAVRDALAQRFGEPESAKLEWRPSTSVNLDEDTARSVMKLVDVLDENDDVQSVYANFEVSEDVLAKLSA
jgi:transcriptional/translational regulatory protein YebC/TACO1